MLRALAVLLVAAALTACSDPAPSQRLVLDVPAEHREAFESFVEFLELPAALAPAGPPGAADLAVALRADLDCRECYRLERDEAGFLVRGGDVLGLQYGLAHLLELHGVRFYHPWKSHVPARLELGAAADAALGVTVEPEMARRGLHLHTLHPTEAYDALWAPGEQNLADARRIVDWVVKNRGNWIYWAALADIQTSDERREAWRRHTRAIHDEIARRGLRSGIAAQLFAAGSLQNNFVLVDADEEDANAAVRAALPDLIDGLSWDSLVLNFGEFFGEEPERFVSALDDAHDAATDLLPGAEIAAVIHVGGDDALRVEYQGQELLYYFLVQFADPAIVPWVHTVMYYNLFEDAGGAYHHDDFAEHRRFLLRRLTRDEPVGYFPETAYWVAFDNSIPTYLPLYVRSRWLDLLRVRDEATARGAAQLDDHLIFSSGWEWGYWQNDYLSLRMSHTLPRDWRDAVAAMLAPLEGGAALAEVIAEVARLEHTHLLEGRLAPYLAGRDLYIDAGKSLDIVSQPDRPSLEEVAAFDASAAAAFESAVLAPLAELAAGLDAAAQRARESGGSDRWSKEIRDGIAITAARARFAHAVFAAALASGRGGDLEELREAADAALAEAEILVAERRADFHHPRPEMLVEGRVTATLYQWGYLKQADTLCYWKRELVELARLLGESEKPVPTCVF